MSKELALWNFAAERLRAGRLVMLLVVAESSGSSPGRHGYKMAVAADGELFGSIGGGVMEMRLVEQARLLLSNPDPQTNPFVVEQVHRKNAENASGMICSGRQSVIFQPLTNAELGTIDDIIAALISRHASYLSISTGGIRMVSQREGSKVLGEVFHKGPDAVFKYTERLGKKNDLYIVGGGHCSLALSELMSRMDFNVHIFDDRPELNTIEKNEFADSITIVDKYENVGEHIVAGERSYVVVMTVGYASDEVVIRSLLGKDLRYLGVLGSKAKMAKLLKQLRDEGPDNNRLDRIHTPIGLPINSHTPDEIAVSIAAEIIAEKNSAAD